MNINFVFIYIDSIILNIKFFNKLISFCVDKNITCYCKSCYMRFVLDIYTTNNACTMEQENDNYFCIFNQRMAPELNIPSNICYYNNGCSLHLSLSPSLSHLNQISILKHTHPPINVSTPLEGKNPQTPKSCSQLGCFHLRHFTLPSSVLQSMSPKTHKNSSPFPSFHRPIPATRWLQRLLQPALDSGT